VSLYTPCVLGLCPSVLFNDMLNHQKKNLVLVMSFYAIEITLCKKFGLFLILIKLLWLFSTGWKFHGRMLGLSTGWNTCPCYLHCIVKSCLDKKLDAWVFHSLCLYENLSKKKGFWCVK
jgi:hypothetical protein